MRKAVSLLFYIFGGIYTTGVPIIGFLDLSGSGGSTTVFQICFAIFSLTFVAIGSALERRGKRKRCTAIVLITVSALSLMNQITFVVLLSSDKMQQLVPPTVAVSWDAVPGSFIFILCLGGSGWWLLDSAKADRARDELARERAGVPHDLFTNY